MNLNNPSTPVKISDIFPAEYEAAKQRARAAGLKLGEFNTAIRALKDRLRPDATDDEWRTGLSALWPTAEIAPLQFPPQSKWDAHLLQSGYEPIAVNEKAPVSQAWQTGPITLDRIKAMRTAYPEARNTGLRTGKLVGVDIDVRNPKHVEQITNLAEQVLGETRLHRFGAKGMLLCYRNETPIRKVTISTKADDAKVEILGTGQQFVAFGIHPDTNKPYRWVREDEFGNVASPITVPFDVLPCVTPEKLSDLADKCAALLGTLGYSDPRVRNSYQDEKKTREANAKEDEPGNISRAVTHLQNCVARGEIAILGQFGNDTIYNLACLLRDRFYLSHGKIESLMLEHWYPHCTPNTLVDECGTIIAHAVQYMQNEAGANTSPPVGEAFKGTLEKLPAPKDAKAPNFKDPTFPDVNQYGMPKCTPQNTRIALKAFDLSCSYDVFHEKLLIQGYYLKQWAGEVSDHGCLILRTMVRDCFNFEPTTQMMHDAVIQLCLQHRFDPVCDYLDGLKWDGTKRLDTWLISYLGAADTPLTRTIGRLALIAAVRRARDPGCKFDQIIVLEGPEGRNKSTAIETMAGKENFSDQHILGVSDKEAQENLQGVWLYEIADLTGIRKADADKVKAFASRTTDRARPAYGRFRLDQKRRCVIFASTNDEQYLQSHNGNRRFWPIKTGEIDIARLKADRDQLWAEAAHQEANGASIVLPKALWPDATAEQAKRLEHDAWEDLLASVSGAVVRDSSGGGWREQIASADLLLHHLKLSADRMTAGTTGKRLRAVMERLGWEYRGHCRFGERANVAGYVRPAAAPDTPVAQPDLDLDAPGF